MKLSSFIYALVCISFLSCQSNEMKSESDISYEIADTTSITGFTGDSVKLVKTASIHCKVNDAHRSARAVSQLAQSLGGMISHQNIESTQNQSKEIPISDDSILVIAAYTTQADITARIPAQNLEEFMYGIADIGYFTFSSRMDIDDRSLDFLANTLKQQNRLQVLSDASHKKVKDINATQVIYTKDEAIGQEITNRRIDADVKYSTLQLNLYQNPVVRKEIIANYTISGYHLPFSKSLNNAFNNGWQYFLNFVLVLAYLWPFIFLAIAVWMIFKYFQSKRRSGLSKA
jgi:hypothetical protein